jgi:methylenetetrahydrofolate dehydrogenase (NADP+)/methenyltetrahydrofolate cyclohydrolase
MTALDTRTLDCRAVAKRFHEWVLREKSALARPPRLTTVLYSPRSNAGSLQYRELIHKDAERLGVDARDLEAGSEGELLRLLGELNADDAVTGVMVFYPIGGDVADQDLMDLVSPHKDVEGLHSVNLGYLIKYKQFHDVDHGVKCVVPATAKAVVKTLQEFEVPVERRFVTIVNNSMRVGKPLGLMLENLGATVVKCYDKTRLGDLEECVRRADIVITAVPDTAFQLDPDWIKPGAAVVDVSYQGNVDVERLSGRASFVTAPGNRIGQVTRALTFVNLVYCARAAELLQRG